MGGVLLASAGLINFNFRRAQSPANRARGMFSHASGYSTLLHRFLVVRCNQRTKTDVSHDGNGRSSGCCSYFWRNPARSLGKSHLVQKINNALWLNALPRSWEGEECQLGAGVSERASDACILKYRSLNQPLVDRLASGQCSTAPSSPGQLNLGTRAGSARRHV
jgi:hypothetical protein